MADVKLTKSELRAQQLRESQLQKYLPTLQLKKAMLQSEVSEAQAEILRCEAAFHDARLSVAHVSGLLSDQVGLDLTQAAKVARIDKEYENVAGVDLPLLKEVVFAPFEYPLFSTPAWLDALVTGLRSMAVARVRVLIATEKKAALERELREVSIRVNLFEKKLIPRAAQHIKRIKVFLGDQELAAVGQAKVAKAKIEQRKHASRRR